MRTGPRSRRSRGPFGVQPEAWAPPEGWRRLSVVDAHAAGEPLRVVLGGFPELRGATVLEMRADARARFDGLRRALVWEPRGHADMYGCLVLPPVTEAADFAVLFLHNEGFSTMCGHGIVAVATVVAELGLVEAPADGALELGVDTPAGFVAVRVAMEAGRPGRVTFRNVPSFVGARGGVVRLPGVGRVPYDLAYGGAFYAFVAAEAVGVELAPSATERLVALGRALKAAVVEAAGEPEHPDDPELSFLYGVIFTGPPEDPAHHSRHVCVFADGEVDRSPTGTGVSARLALLDAVGDLAEDEEVVIESILGTTFTGRVAGRTTVGRHPAVIPEVGGRGWITGRGELLVDPDDPLGEGFLLR